MTQQLYFDTINIDGPKKKILSFEEDYEKITYKIQFEDLCKILGKPVGYDTPDIGVQ